MTFMLKCCFIFFSIFLCIVSIYISFNGVEYAHNRYQRAMMRLVRDIGRIRARKGQTGMNYALVPVLMGSDDGKDSLNIFKDHKKKYMHTRLRTHAHDPNTRHIEMRKDMYDLCTCVHACIDT